MATVTYDSVATLARFAKRRKIGFTQLADPKSEIVRAFDLLDESFWRGGSGHGVAHPIAFVLDNTGRITERFSTKGNVSHAHIDEVLKAIRRTGGLAG